MAAGYRDFDLDLRGVQLQPVAKDILIAHLMIGRLPQLAWQMVEHLQSYLVNEEDVKTVL